MDRVTQARTSWTVDGRDKGDGQPVSITVRTATGDDAARQFCANCGLQLDGALGPANR